ncbi:protein kinase domain-containing protein [Streptomyces sp. E11-3]|uniref:serine/threonine-protein kinase n=1 Tax=Streptomyces sp. E11-3 TaxID=3110112 RepID=UPI00397FF09F
MSGQEAAGGIFQQLEEDDPRTVAGYRLTAKLGSGGMGKVYLSYTPGGRPVAIKVIRPDFSEDLEFRRRFQQEVQAAQRVQGLYTAPVIDSDTESAKPWLATAYVPGPALSAAVAEHGPLPVETVLLLVAGIAEALHVIHGAGIVHRDLKPSNVLLAADGPRVIDFGIARAADATSLTGSGVTIGTPAFMAPEQAAGRQVTAATDIFALGQIAAYAAIGSPAFGEGTSHGVLYRIVHEEPDLTGLPDALRELVTRCLAKDPADRPSVTDVISLCQAANTETVLRRPEDWLPGAVAADITVRAAAPAPAQTPPPHAPAPAQPAPPVTAPGQPVPPVPTQLSAPAAPPPGFGPAAYQATAPQQPAMQQPATQQSVPQQPVPQVTGPQPTPSAPPKKSRTLAVAVAVALVFGIGGAGAAYVLTRDGDSDSGKSNQAAQQDDKKKQDTDTDTDTDAGRTGQAPEDSDEPSGQESDDDDDGTQPVPDPDPVKTSGIDLTGGYHVSFTDDPVKPDDSDETAKDLQYNIAYVGERFSSGDGSKMVLLNNAQKGSLEVCRSDTRYASDITLDRLSKGSQVLCADQFGAHRTGHLQPLLAQERPQQVRQHRPHRLAQRHRRRPRELNSVTSGGRV